MYPMIFWGSYMSLVLSLPLVKISLKLAKLKLIVYPSTIMVLGEAKDPTSPFSGVKSLFVSERTSPKKTLKQFARGLQKDCWNGIELVFQARCAYFVCRCNSGSTFCDFSECSNSAHFVTMGCEGQLS